MKEKQTSKRKTTKTKTKNHKRTNENKTNKSTSLATKQGLPDQAELTGLERKLDR